MSSILPTSVGKSSFSPQWRSSRGKCFIFRRGYNIIYIHICIYSFMYLYVVLYFFVQNISHIPLDWVLPIAPPIFFAISHDIRTISPFIFPNIPITHKKVTISHEYPHEYPHSWCLIHKEQLTVRCGKLLPEPFGKWSTFMRGFSNMGSHIELLVYSSVIPITIW